MRYRRGWRLLLIPIILTGSLACSLFSGLDEKTSGLQETAKSVGKDLQKGQGMLETAQSFATKAFSLDMVQTAEALVTQQGPGVASTAMALVTAQGPGLIETLQAFATEEGPSLMSTAEAFATQQGPGLAETAQALVTDQGPGLIATIKALATPGADLLATGQAMITQLPISTPVPPDSQSIPSDIPMPDGEKQIMGVTPQSVSYTIGISLQGVLAFYEEEMPKKGWSKSVQGSVVTQDAAVINFEKPGERAILTLSIDPGSGQTIVLITLQG